MWEMKRGTIDQADGLLKPEQIDQFLLHRGRRGVNRLDKTPWEEEHAETSNAGQAQ